jgi:hypothetical protein
MRQAESRVGNSMITLGGVIFMLVLFVSAYWEADIRWLHFFQAWMYIAAIALVWKNSKWGLFIGFGAAVFWNYTTLFVNTFLKNGLEQASLLIHSGHLLRPDLFISVPAWFGNLCVIVGCCVVYIRRSDKNRGDASRALVAFAAATAFFALIMALFQPRYLALFPQCLHPKLHL